MSESNTSTQNTFTADDFELIFHRQIAVHYPKDMYKQFVDKVLDSITPEHAQYILKAQNEHDLGVIVSENDNSPAAFITTSPSSFPFLVLNKHHGYFGVDPGIMAHELTHFKQWKEGRLNRPGHNKPTLSYMLCPLEREANWAQARYNASRSSFLKVPLIHYLARRWMTWRNYIYRTNIGMLALALTVLTFFWVQWTWTQDIVFATSSLLAVIALILVEIIVFENWAYSRIKAVRLWYSRP